MTRSGSADRSPDAAAHPSDRVRRVIAALGGGTLVQRFPAGTRTAADAAAAIGCPVGAIAKSLVFLQADQPLLVLASGAVQVDTNRLAALQAQPITRPDAERVRQVSGFAIGGVAPVGWPIAPEAVMDRSLLAFDQIWCAAGTPDTVFATTPAALQAMTAAVLADIARI